MEVRLLVSNLASTSTEDELMELFSDYGEVLEVTLSEEDANGALSAIVTMVDEDEAADAADALQGQKLNRMPMRIAFLDEEDDDEFWDEDEEEGEEVEAAYDDDDTFDDDDDDYDDEDDDDWDDDEEEEEDDYSWEDEPESMTKF